MLLPDPRRYGNGQSSPLATLAQNNDDGLTAAVATAVTRGDDAAIRAAFAAVTSREAFARLRDAVALAVDRAPDDAAIVTRIFALPVLLVCGTRGGATLPGVVNDTGELVQVLEASGALGGNRNLGFGNALIDLDTLENVTPSAIRAWQSGAGLRDVPPAPIRLTPGDESVHLRFLLGAAVSVPHLPGIAETAANVEAWGLKATKALSPQLSAPGVDVLAMPRPPLNVVKAAHAGRRIGLEAAFNLFVSNTLRRFRQKVGDATAIVSAHEGGELRVTLSSPLDEGLTEGYRWPLHPLDDVDEIAGMMQAFLQDCRLTDIVLLPKVQPDTTSTGALYFPTTIASGPAH